VNQTSDYRFWFYMRFSILNGFALSLLLIFWKKLTFIQLNIKTWVFKKDNTRERFIFFYLGLILVFSYFTKAHLGFWWQSIPGWIEIRNDSAIPYNDVSSHPNVTGRFREILYQGINENGEFGIFGNQTKTTEYYVKLLHFSNGQILPSNYGIYQFVFPSYILGSYSGPGDMNLMFRLTKYSLEIQSYRNSWLFRLPKFLAYPSHTVFYEFPYQDYPHANSLENISIWKVKLKLNTDSIVEIIEANLVTSFKKDLEIPK
jgi:hypothetical protein